MLPVSFFALVLAWWSSLLLFSLSVTLSALCPHRVSILWAFHHTLTEKPSVVNNLFSAIIKLLLAFIKSSVTQISYFYGSKFWLWLHCFLGDHQTGNVRLLWDGSVEECAFDDIYCKISSYIVQIFN